jgi:predicted amidohydrolase
MKVALVQLRSTRTFSENLVTVCSLIGQAADGGASYIQTPEMTTLIERDRERMGAQITHAGLDSAVQRFSNLAAKHGVMLHIGSMAVPLSDGRFANRAHLFGPDGGLITTYDKVHMFDVDLAGGESWRESAIYAPGGRCAVVDLGAAIVGLGICYDLRFAGLFRAQAQAGANILTVPAAFTKQTGEAHWHVLLRARAIETGSFVMAAAQGGAHEDGRETYGHSLVIDPWGKVIAEKADDEPGVLFAEIDFGAVADARTKIPALAHDRSFELDHIAIGTKRAVE